VPFRSVGSTAIGPAEWLELTALIHQTAAERPELTGFVVPHVTATLEETAYFLNPSLKTDKTVVLVGAQRPASALSSDAGMNLLSAVRTASAAAAILDPVLKMAHQKILILDFGAQYSQLIARRVREASVYCELHPYDVSDQFIRNFRPGRHHFVGRAGIGNRR
jgi:hypothetical protein